MIPTFPEFKRLKLADRIEYENYVIMFAPYSDYNFVSLWTYNTREEVEICHLNTNLVVKFTDYETLKPFYSFLGTTKIDDTIYKLLELSKNQDLKPILKLVPEISIEKLATVKVSNLIVEEDENNNDYVLSLRALSKMEGKNYAMHRNLINRFLTRVGKYNFKEVMLSDLQTETQINDLFNRWETNKGMGAKFDNEHEAIRRLLTDIGGESIKLYGVFSNSGKMLAFSISELLQNKFVMGHYRKADISYPGIFQLLEKETCAQLCNLGYEFINYEQDLGIPGLRQAKRSWNPVGYLKKYTIKPKNAVI